MKDFIKKHSILLPVALYGIIYMTSFSLLEKRVQEPANIIHSVVDDYIPFIEFFAIPYYLWFAFVAAFGIYFYFKSREDFGKLAINLMIGMTIFIIVSAVFPNGHDLRPAVFPRDNIFTDMVKHLYSIDTPTNILPSIHVYNTLGIYFAVKNSKSFKDKRLWRIITSIISWSIIASTVFLKQHSIIDVLLAFAIELPVCMVLYKKTATTARGFKGKNSIKTALEEPNN